MIRVHISPTYTDADKADGGIRRVVEAQAKYLPEFDVEAVSDPGTADLLAVHGTMIPERNDLPIVNHNHGLYWREYDWPLWADGTNRAVIDRMTRAEAVTAPSKWVANAISRGTLIRPEVIYHGVDADLWTPAESQGYVLWNKARADAVSDPSVLSELAARLPSLPFVTTFGPDGPNIHRTGAISVDDMRSLVSHAGVYLATTRETFGIGTLEALACGVPVVGWRFGGQEEIIIDGETGILVEFGDIDALASAIRTALDSRQRMGGAARADTIARWGWQSRIELYANLYKRVYDTEQGYRNRPRTSVVVTTHNLNRFLPEAYASAIEQADEVIVVDDCGTEDARAVLPPDAKVIRPEKNLGLSGARNLGAQHAAGRYLLFLDADDMLTPGACGILSSALDADRGLHIAAGALDTISENGSGRRRNPWPSGAISWRAQCAHLNQLHYAAMWRREAFLRSGGYRSRHWRAEDAAHWMRVFSFGLRAAQVTPEPTLLYRMRSDSKSREEARLYADRDGDWTIDYPWRIGDGTPQGGEAALTAGHRPHPWRVPFGAPGGSPGRKAWPVPHYQEPAVSVVIPVGQTHRQYVVDALDSLIAQDVDRWEAIVVNDGVGALELSGHPWARVVNLGSAGAGAARNEGVKAARAPLVLFLDADDMLQTGALRTLLARYAAGDVSFVYGDCAVATKRLDQPTDHLRAAEFSAPHWIVRAANKEGLGLPAVTMLVAREHVLAVGGFDEAMPAWEDGDLYLKLAAAGYTGARVDSTILTYRVTTGQRREMGEKQAKKLRDLLAKRYAPHATEDAFMARRCCGGHGPAITLAQSALEEPDFIAAEPAFERTESGEIRMAYIGDQVGEHSVFGRVSRRVYRVGNNPFNKHFSADPRDVDHLLSLGLFEIVKRPVEMAQT